MPAEGVFVPSAWNVASHFPISEGRGTRSSRSPRPLVALANADGRVLTRDQLLCGVWGYNAGVLTRTVDMHIAELRQKLERVPSQPSLIVTVRAVGYRMATDDATKATTPSSDSLSA